jgi:trans-aconitate 2-methyltransferase
VSRDAWDPARYQRFGDERQQPFWDLAALVQGDAPGLVVDLGCGTGELTAALHQRWHATRTIGIDSSVAMLANAPATPGVTFVQDDIESWTAGAPVDVVFSNAALQWVPDHERLLPRLAGMLAPGGQIAVQMPANFDHPSHRVAADVAREPEFQDALQGYVRTVPVLAPERYAELLHELSFEDQHVRLQVYGHELPSTAAVADWTRGTLLTAYEARMPPSVYARFLSRYREHLLAALGERAPYFYAFKRILFWGRRSGERSSS